MKVASKNIVAGKDEIAARAYEIYVAEGRPEGRAADHWRRAEELVLVEHSKVKSHARQSAHAVGKSVKAQPRTLGNLIREAYAGDPKSCW